MSLLDHVSAFAGRRVEGLPLREARGEFEAAYFLGVLRLCDGNVSEAARVAGMDRAGLYQGLWRAGLSPDGSGWALDRAKRARAAG